jgi:hypothetical protein
MAEASAGNVRIAIWGQGEVARWAVGWLKPSTAATGVDPALGKGFFRVG